MAGWEDDCGRYGFVVAMTIPGWFIPGLPNDIIWDWAEFRRSQRSAARVEVMMRRLARQRVRYHEGNSNQKWSH